MATETKAPETHSTHAKASQAHPLASEAGSLRDELVKVTEKHREEVAKLREKVAELLDKIQGETLSKHNELVLGGLQTEVESALNRLDPDCTAAAYVKKDLTEEEQKKEDERRKHEQGQGREAR